MCTVPTNEAAPPQSEARLIALAKDGNEQAFEAIFCTYHRRVYSLCARMTGDLSVAEDLTQDTFLQLIRGLRTFRNESAFGTWFHRLTVNVVLMHLRKKRVQEVPYEQPDTKWEDPVWREYGADDQRLAGLIDRIVMHRAMRQLPEGQRAVFVLHDIEGFRHAEIAKLLDCSLGNSKSQLSRARRNMRKLLCTRRVNRPSSLVKRDANIDGQSVEELPGKWPAPQFETGQATCVASWHSTASDSVMHAAMSLEL